MLVFLVAATVTMAAQVLRGSCLVDRDQSLPPCFDQPQIYLDEAAGTLAADSTGTDQAALNRALDDISRSLTQRPVNPYAWSMFAVVQLRRGQHYAAAVALDRSLDVGPHEHSLVVTQVQLAALLWNDLSRDRQDQVCGLIDWYRKLEPESFQNDLASGAGALGDVVKSCLARST